MLREFDQIKNNHNYSRRQLKQMQSQQSLPKECQFCTEITLQKRHLFFNLIKTFSKELQKIAKKSQNDLVDHENASFRQLLRIVFGEQVIEHGGFCQHKKILTYFSIKLKCPEEFLNYVAQKISHKLAERNYHLQLLTLQIKNSAESVVDGKIKVKDQEQSSENIVRKIKRTKNKKNYPAQKVAIKMEAEQNDGVMPTGSTLNGISMSYIPVFNSQLNIGEPAQTTLTMGNMGNMGNVGNVSFYYPYQIYYPNQNQ